MRKVAERKRPSRIAIAAEQRDEMGAIIPPIYASRCWPPGSSCRVSRAILARLLFELKQLGSRGQTAAPNGRWRT
jgi:hypothetical protein